MDEYLLRKILKTPSSTSKEALYLETGCIPIRYILMKRRLMYYHHIIKRPSNELINKFYKAQKLKPSKGDWVKLIENDKQILKIDHEDEEIEKMSKYKFKKFVKKVIAEGALAYLLKIKETHSKLKDLKCVLEFVIPQAW